MCFKALESNIHRKKYPRDTGMTKTVNNGAPSVKESQGGTTAIMLALEQ